MPGWAPEAGLSPARQITRKHGKRSMSGARELLHIRPDGARDLSQPRHIRGTRNCHKPKHSSARNCRIADKSGTKGSVTFHGIGPSGSGGRRPAKRIRCKAGYGRQPPVASRDRRPKFWNHKRCGTPQVGLILGHILSRLRQQLQKR